MMVTQPSLCLVFTTEYLILPSRIKQVLNQTAYDDTLRSLLDKHAPFRPVRHSVRPSLVWYDAECRATRRVTQNLERVYRRSLTVESCAACMEDAVQ